MALAQVFSCEFCEIFKNTFFAERLWTTGFACERLGPKYTWFGFLNAFGLTYLREPNVYGFILKSNCFQKTNETVTILAKIYETNFSVSVK